MQPFRFAIISDPHVTLPHTVYDVPNRFHLVEVSIAALEEILATLATADLDFLLLPGDLTQHGERENHQWLAQRLRSLPFPAYVVPGNHDIITPAGDDRTVGLGEFPTLYADFGYGGATQPYYCREVGPGVRLLGLNSIAFDGAGAQLPYGWVDEAQLGWLRDTLAEPWDGLTLAMIHHNLLDHLPGQHRHPLGQRYSIRNRQALRDQLQAVPLLLTGHLHVQDVAQQGSLWEVTTGSLVSYPHPYRVVTVTPMADQVQVQIESHRVQAVPDWPDLQGASLDWMRNRAIPFMTRLLSLPPFNLPAPEASRYAPMLKDFWATIAAGDGRFDEAHWPESIQRHFRAFGAVDAQGCYRPIDNTTTLMLPQVASASVVG
ncbi:MAG: metallophosphoesterase [Cyanobacteria bacterium]|nr:metallophosphoesterase [Cyanobacteriota bacterium]